jgi:hypothetical protein
MKRLAVFGLGALVAIALVTASVSGASRTPTSRPGTFSKLRVCSSTAFSRAQRRCTKDERGTPLVSNRISCSVDLSVRRPNVLRRQWLYEGQPVAFAPLRIGERGRWSFWINENLKINLPLPGGRWACSYSFGSAKVKASFTSAGPVGEIVNTAACRLENTLVHGNGLRVCRSDESATPMQPTSSVWCFATYPSDKGRDASIAVASAGKVLGEVSFTVGGPLWLGVATASAPAGQSTVAPGSYSCQYSLDGALVTEKPFEVLG